MSENVELVRRSFEAMSVVAGSCRVRGRVSGAESHPACAWLIGVRDGRILSHRTCASYDEALQAAGVEPAEDRAG